MEDLISTVVQNGFSVAVAAYLLVRMERRLEELSLAIRDLQGAITGSGRLYDEPRKAVSL